MRGFLQDREAEDIWHYIQAHVELSLQQSVPLAGVISDVRKAFEPIPRCPLFPIAQHLGVPASILRAWQTFFFLTQFRRRLTVHDAISEPIWDPYQTVFAPRTVHLSNVDNYEVLPASCAEVLPLSRST